MSKVKTDTLARIFTTEQNGGMLTKYFSIFLFLKIRIFFLYEKKKFALGVEPSLSGRVAKNAIF